MTTSLDPYEAPLPEFGDDTTIYQGHCRSVEPETDVDELIQPAAVGDTVLHLDFVEGFYPGATIQVADGSGDDGQGFLVVIAGHDEAVDYAADTLTLTSGLPVAVDVGTEVHVWSVQRGERVTEYSASVIPDDDEAGDPIEITVPHTTVPYLRAGIEAGDGVAVSYRREPGKGLTDFELVDILGAQPSADAGTLDPETYPDDLGGDTGPTEPPATSPGVEITGLPDGLAIQLLERPEAGARVQYHLSADPVAGVNFVPSAATASGPETAAGVRIADALPDGTAFVVGTTYYARAVAVNDLGEAPAGAGAEGALNVNAIREQFIAVLRTGFLMTGRIDIGDGYISADEGIMIPHPDGSWSQIPFDGSPVRLLAEVIATLLTVSGIATFLALVRVRRRLEVGDGISAPTEAPTVADHWPALPSPPGARGLVPHATTDSGLWVTARSNGGSVDLRSHPRTGSVLGGSTFMASTNLINYARGLTYASGRYWVLGYDQTQWKLVGLLATNPADVLVRHLGASYLHQPALGVVGGLLAVAYVAPGNGGGNELRVTQYPGTGDADFGTVPAVIAQAVSFTDLAWIGQGTFNYGAVRIVVQPTDADALLWSGSLPNPNRIPSGGFKRALGGTVGGMAWDGTRLQALVGNQIAAHAQSRTAAEAVTVAHSWAGQTAAGVSIETNAGATVAATIGAQAQALVTVPAPPEADLADPGKANRAGVYADVAGTRRRQGAVLPRGTRVAVIDVLSAAGRAAAATGTFDSSPADVVPERGTDETKMWRLFGSGAGFISDLAWSATGAWTFGTRFVAAIYGMFRATAAGFRAPNATQSTTSGTAAVVVLTGTESHTSARITRSGSEITILDTGLYVIQGYIRFGPQSTPAGARTLSIESFTTEAANQGTRLAGDGIFAGAGSLILACSTDILLTAGTKIRMVANQTSGGALVLNDISQLNVRRVG